MRAMMCRSFAPIENLRLETIDDPVAMPGTVIVDVIAAGINFHDGLIVQGKYQTKPTLPFSPGSEVTGVVRKVGEDVAGLSIGDRVLAFCGIGGYAEAVAVPATQIWRLPETVDCVRAAGFIVSYGTAWHALRDRAGLRRGETLLVLGAAGGVGLAAVELGKLLGAHVIAAASSPNKLALAREHGADNTIDHTTENLRQRVKELTDGRGVDVAYDPVGGALADEAVRSLAWKGRYVIVGFAAGEIQKIAANQLLLKSADALGVIWGASLKADPVHHATNVAELLDLYARDALRPHIPEIHPLADAVDALRRVMDRQVMGKIVLTTAREAYP
jgi:NADPH2:quinone reductase